MGRSFLFLVGILSVALFLVLLFLPISFKIAAHYDMNRKKFCFSVYLFSFLKIIGGYIATYKGGFAIHVSEKKAFLLPYSQINSERKRFSFMNTFRLVSALLTTETGAEYLLPSALAHTALRTIFFAKGGEKENIQNNLWLTDGDVLRVSFAVGMKFTLFILLKNLLRFIKEKMKSLWQKKMKKSTV